MSRGERLAVKTIVDCSNCGGSGLWHDGTACGDCGGRGWVESHRSPTPADLLTDPRVRAVVAALWTLDGWTARPSLQTVDAVCKQVKEALAPFAGVFRG